MRIIHFLSAAFNTTVSHIALALVLLLGNSAFSIPSSKPGIVNASNLAIVSGKTSKILWEGNKKIVIFRNHMITIKDTSNNEETIIARNIQFVNQIYPEAEAIYLVAKTHFTLDTLIKADLKNPNSSKYITDGSADAFVFYKSYIFSVMYYDTTAVIYKSDLSTVTLDGRFLRYANGIVIASETYSDSRFINKEDKYWVKIKKFKLPEKPSGWYTQLAPYQTTTIYIGPRPLCTKPEDRSSAPIESMGLVAGRYKFTLWDPCGYYSASVNPSNLRDIQYKSEKP